VMKPETGSGWPLPNRNSTMERKKNWKLVIGDWLFKYRSLTPLPLIILVFLLFRPRQINGLNGMINAIGIGLALGGELIRVLTVGFSLSGTSGREVYFRADGINTRGSYSITRNPLYVGNFFIFLGLLVVYSNVYAILFFMPFLVLQYYFIILSEEQFLTRSHGSQYEQYRHLTPRVLPRLKNFKRPATGFDGHKVLFKENDSVFNLMIMLLMILMWKERTFSGSIRHGLFFGLGAGLLTAVYILVKVLKKRGKKG
jgi:protein-S-isoprenylcysteine O-methyltransferase Ste14